MQARFAVGNRRRTVKGRRFLVIAFRRVKRPITIFDSSANCLQFSPCAAGRRRSYNPSIARF